MFSIDAIVNITITSITVSNSSGMGMEVWSKEGNYTGFESNATVWTRVGGEWIDKMCHIILYMQYRIQLAIDLTPLSRLSS